MSEVKFKEATNQLAAEVKKDMTVNKEGIIEVPEDFYERHLPDDLTMETVQRMQDHNARLISSVGLAVGELGIEAMKKDKKLDQVSVECRAGNDTLGSFFQRSRQVPDGSGGMKTAFGSLSSKYTVSGATNRGELKKVRTHLAGLAKEALGG